MHLGYLTTLLTTLSLTLTGQAHDKISAKRHWGRHSRPGLAASNTTSFESRGQLEKRYDNARFSFYDAGLSACGGTFSNSDYIVALNVAQYAGGALCFQTITITAKGKTTTAKIVDECEGCPYAGLDFSRGLFDFFASESEGLIYGTWSLGADTPHYSTSSTWQAPTPTPTPTPTITPTTNLWTTTTSWTSTASSWTHTASNTTTATSSNPTPSSTNSTTVEEEEASGLIGSLYALYVQLGTMVVVA